MTRRANGAGTTVRNCDNCGISYTAVLAQMDRGRGLACSIKCGKARPHETKECEFWLRVDRASTPDGCWNWRLGVATGGYGLFSFMRKTERAHRYSWQLANGEIPAGLFVLHHCDNRACVRPSHLFVGTQDDNMKDMAAKGRSLAGERNPAKHHPDRLKRGEDNTKAKLTARDVRTIRSLATTVPRKDLADRFDVTLPTIGHIIRRQTWKHI